MSGAATAALRVQPTPPGAPLSTGPELVSPRATEQVSGILADLEDFWGETLGEQFTPLESGYALIDSSDPAMPQTQCVSQPDSLRGNAFYCPDDDGIVIDAGALVPVLLHSYGLGGLAAAIAHEYGHAVQARIGPTRQDQESDPQAYPRILVEAQADCAAGAFLRRASQGGTVRLRLPEAQLLRAVSPLIDFRDPAGAPVDDPLAHGLGLDRLRFVLTGFSGGSAACPQMTPESLQLTLGHDGVVPPGKQPRLADDAATDAAAAASLAAFDDTAGTGSPPADPADLATAASIGQFARAAATVLAAGRERFPDAAGAACFTGAWTAAVFGADSPDGAEAGDLGGWASDADEALDLIRNRPGAQFADLVGFASGYDDGLAACPR